MEICLNLLPSQKKDEMISNSRFYSILKLELSFTVVLFFLFGILAFFTYVLNLDLISQRTAKEQGEKSPQFEKMKQYEDGFRQINSDLAGVIRIDSEQMYWSNVLTKIEGAIFPGITVDALSSEGDNSMKIVGTADNRDDLVLLKEKLGNSGCFSDINLPLSDLVDKDNVTFEISLNISPDCLKNK